jgi:hypothetical protein
MVTRLTGQRRTWRAPTRHPALGLSALVVCGLLATFFAWVTAEPLWLAVGHGSQGTATVIHCSGHGLDQRCRARFTAADDRFTAQPVDLVGAPAEQLGDGSRVAARMVSPTSRLAYAGNGAGLALRWVVGLALVLLCGGAVALATGAHRLPRRRTRWYALLASITGPLLLMAAMLFITH